MLHQQTARSKADCSAEQRRAQFALAGQNLPATDHELTTAQAESTAQIEPPTSYSPVLDPAMSPENISALLSALQTQQASLDTTMSLGGSASGPGGKTLLDYLTSSETIANDAANNDGTTAVAPNELS